MRDNTPVYDLGFRHHELRKAEGEGLSRVGEKNVGTLGIGWHE